MSKDRQFNKHRDKVAFVKTVPAFLRQYAAAAGVTHPWDEEQTSLNAKRCQEKEDTFLADVSRPDELPTIDNLDKYRGEVMGGNDATLDDQLLKDVQGQLHSLSHKRVAAVGGAGGYGEDEGTKKKHKAMPKMEKMKEKKKKKEKKVLTEEEKEKKKKKQKKKAMMLSFGDEEEEDA